MSIADEFYVHLFPDNTPVNIANPADLRRLKEMFPTEELYIVVGSDVIHNASSYKKDPEENSIHSFNHIVFRRLVRHIRRRFTSRSPESRAAGAPAGAGGYQLHEDP